MSSGEFDGYLESKKLRGLAAEEVPNPYETKGYWYTRFQNLKNAVENYFDYASFNHGEWQKENPPHTIPGYDCDECLRIRIERHEIIKEALK